MKKIIFAGGCFWGVEAYFKKLKGVIETDVGYVNGNYANPTYEEVCDAEASHAEGVLIVYDPLVITLEKLLEHLFRIIDPISLNKQGHDVGVQYRTGVYFDDFTDEIVIHQFIHEKQKTISRPIMVEVQPNRGFYDAELYHQDYLDKNPHGYCHVNFAVMKKEEMK